MKPDWPRENRPVKPLSRFMEEATTAYTAPFFSTVKSMWVGFMVFSSRITRASNATVHRRTTSVPRLLFFSCSTVDPSLTLCR